MDLNSQTEMKSDVTIAGALNQAHLGQMIRVSITPHIAIEDVLTEVTHFKRDERQSADDAPNVVGMVNLEFMNAHNMHLVAMPFMAPHDDGWDVKPDTLITLI